MQDFLCVQWVVGMTVISYFVRPKATAGFEFLKEGVGILAK